MAEINYIDSIQDENGKQHPIKDTELSQTVNNLSDDVETLGGRVDKLERETPDSIDVKTVYNTADEQFYHIWVGTAADYEVVEKKPDVIYFVGEGIADIPDDPVVPGDCKVNVELIHCQFSNPVPQKIEYGGVFSNVLNIDDGYQLEKFTVKINTRIIEGALAEDGKTVYFDNIDGDVVITGLAVIPLEEITIEHNNIAVTGANSNGFVPGLVFGSNTYKYVAILKPNIPNDDINSSVQWRINVTPVEHSAYFRLDTNGKNATLNVLSGADGDSVEIICWSTYYIDNNGEPTISANRTLSNISYVSSNNSVVNDHTIIIPPSPLTPGESSDNDGILAGRLMGSTNIPVPNKVELKVWHNGVQQENVEFSFRGTVPQVHHVYDNDGEIVDELVNIAELEDNILTFKADCTVEVECTVNGTTYTKKLNINHGKSDYIYFEDDRVKQCLLTGFWNGSKENITYDDAADVTSNNFTKDQSILMGTANNPKIKYFNEWQYFLKAQLGVANQSELISVKLPYLPASNGVFRRVFNLLKTGLTKLEIPEGYSEINFNGSQGNPPSGIFTEIKFPTSLQSITSSFGSFYPAAETDGQLVGRLQYVTELDFSNTKLNSLCASVFTYLTSLTTVKFPDSLERISNIYTFIECRNISRIEFGTEFKGVYNDNGATYSLFKENLPNRLVTYVFHSDTPPTHFSFANRGVESILVPDGCKDDYVTAFGATYYDKIIETDFD